MEWKCNSEARMNMGEEERADGVLHLLTLLGGDG